MMTSPGIFLIFPKLWFFQVVSGGKRAKNGPEWQKILSLMLHISGTIHHMIVIFGTHVWNDNISRCCFHFFKILIFRVVRGVKRAKMVQNEKIFCLSCFISQEPCIIWLSFMVHMCKIISAGVFFSYFQNFDFSGCYRGKRAKNGPKWQKILSVTLRISGTIWLSF